MATMQYTNITGVDKPVSRILYGTASAPFIKGTDQNELLDQIVELGVTAFDTARVYGQAEQTLGNWMKERECRKDVVILSKGGHPGLLWNKRINEKEIRKDFILSAKNLQTEFIDIYLLHRDDEKVEAGILIEILNAMHEEGKIGAFGGSNWTHERISEANEYAYKHDMIPFTVSSPNYSLAEQVCDPWGGGCVTISGKKNESAREWYKENQMPVVAYSSLGSGFLSGKQKGMTMEEADRILDKAVMKAYGVPDNFERLQRCEELSKEKGCTVPQIAMAWLMNQELNTFAVVSTLNAKRMEDNILALDIPMTNEEMRYLDLQE